MEALNQYWIPYTVSNAVAILFLLAAIKRPKLARFLFCLLFAWACWMNYTTSHNNPTDYLAYADMAIPVYKSYINGWFKDHITVMVTLISIGQGAISLGMLLKGWWVRLAGTGAIIFLMGIAPLGVGSAFPFSITVSLAAYFILKKDDLDYIWKFRNLNS
jgi:hypothetical protein